MTYEITSQKELRKAFWERHPKLRRVPGWTQNQYPADTRVAWCDFVENMCREGEISFSLSMVATL